MSPIIFYTSLFNGKMGDFLWRNTARNRRIFVASKARRRADARVVAPPTLSSCRRVARAVRFLFGFWLVKNSEKNLQKSMTKLLTKASWCAIIEV